jgi:hypothetical protein
VVGLVTGSRGEVPGITPVIRGEDREDGGGNHNNLYHIYNIGE